MPENEPVEMIRDTAGGIGELGMVIGGDYVRGGRKGRAVNERRGVGRGEGRSQIMTHLACMGV